MTIHTYNGSLYASYSFTEDLMMKIKRSSNDVNGMAEMRRHHLFNAAYDTGEKLLLATYGSTGLGWIGALIQYGFGHGYRIILIANNSNWTVSVEVDVDQHRQ